MSDDHSSSWSVDNCPTCATAMQAPKHSICWACGHVVDHAIGHDCLWDFDDS